jgi:glycerol-3-phosphate dehydrogenase (NAD(P)+)
MALKNAYATAGGIWDGLCAIGRVEGGAAHNAKALLFAQALREMAAVTSALGGRAETVFGIAGAGDLHVTQAAGRNRAYGEAVGRGGAPEAVAREMGERGELTEGYPAIRTAWQLVRERGLSGLPLLAALHAIVYEGAPVDATLRAVSIGS